MDEKGKRMGAVKPWPKREEKRGKWDNTRSVEACERDHGGERDDR